MATEFVLVLVKWGLPVSYDPFLDTQAPFHWHFSTWKSNPQIHYEELQEEQTPTLTMLCLQTSKTATLEYLKNIEESIKKQWTFYLTTSKDPMKTFWQEQVNDPILRNADPMEILNTNKLLELGANYMCVTRSDMNRMTFYDFTKKSIQLLNNQGWIIKDNTICSDNLISQKINCSHVSLHKKNHSLLFFLPCFDIY